MNRGILFGGLAITALLVAILASGFGRDMHKVRSPLVGRVAPPFLLDRIDGKGAISLQSLKGKPAVVNFWSTWCGPCQQEHGVLQRGSVRWGSQVQFVGIVYDDEPARITKFLQKHGGSYPTIVDKGGTTAIAYGVYGVPETYFLNADGRIVEKYEGPLSPQLLDGYIAGLGVGG